MDEKIKIKNKYIAICRGQRGESGERGEDFNLDDSLVPQEAYCSEEDGDAGEMRVEVAGPLEEGLAEGGPIKGLSEQREELTCVPDGLLLIGRQLLKKGRPVQ